MYIMSLPPSLQVPGLWATAAYPSLKPLSSWVKDLVLRLHFIEVILVHTHSKCITLLIMCECIYYYFKYNYFSAGFWLAHLNLTGCLDSSFHKVCTCTCTDTYQLWLLALLSLSPSLSLFTYSCPPSLFSLYLYPLILYRFLNWCIAESC